MKNEPAAREFTLILFASLFLLFCGPYMVVKLWRPFHPQLFGELFYVQFGSGETGLIGESRLPANWFRQRLGGEATSALNLIFFRTQGKIDLLITGRKVFL